MDHLATPAPTADLETTSSILEPGLFGTTAAERFTRLKANLAPELGPKPDEAALAKLVARFAAQEIRLPELIQGYADLTDVRRWPIVVVRPSGDRQKTEDRLLALGFPLVPSLVSAYRALDLIPLRIPPEPQVILQFARRPDIQRIERAWLRGAAPPRGPAEPSDDLIFPDRLLSRDGLPEELFGQRDPVRVGLLDSGLDARHPALQTRLLDQRAFQRNDDRVGDRFGHGTACAGVMLKLCPSVAFYSAKALDRQGSARLDDVLRALGWLKRQQPDLIVVNFLFHQGCDGRAILAHVVEDLVKSGIPVIVPAVAQGDQLYPPACAKHAISVAAAEDGQAGSATLRARGKGLRVPRSIQADAAHFPEQQPTGWTSLRGSAVAAAVAAGTAALLMRQARLQGRELSPEVLKAWLVRGCDERRVLDPRRALDLALQEETAPMHADVLYTPTLDDMTAPMEGGAGLGKLPFFDPEATEAMRAEDFAPTGRQTRKLYEASLQESDADLTGRERKK
jgi:hypothetical protein